MAVLTAGCTGVEHGKESSAPAGQRPNHAEHATAARSGPETQQPTVAELLAGWSIDNSNSGDNASTPSCLQRLDSELHTNDKADASFVKGRRRPHVRPGHRPLRGQRHREGQVLDRRLLYGDYDNTLDMDAFYTLAQSAADKMP